MLAEAPLNVARRREGHDEANSIWPWGGGYRPKMLTLQQMYPEIQHGDVISAVDLIRGIGHYAGLHNIVLPGATGLANMKARHVLLSKPSARTTSYSSTWKPATKQDTTATYS